MQPNRDMCFIEKAIDIISNFCSKSYEDTVYIKNSTLIKNLWSYSACLFLMLFENICQYEKRCAIIKMPYNKHGSHDSWNRNDITKVAQTKAIGQ